jgi:hypothetical protein
MKKTQDRKPFFLIPQIYSPVNILLILLSFYLTIQKRYDVRTSSDYINFEDSVLVQYEAASLGRLIPTAADAVLHPTRRDSSSTPLPTHKNSKAF